MRRSHRSWRRYLLTSDLNWIIAGIIVRVLRRNPSGSHSVLLDGAVSDRVQPASGFCYHAGIVLLGSSR
jgi:hypothetical protein